MNDYTLNLAIPIGPTGPKGPQGKQGPHGPTTLEDLIFIQFNNSFTQGLLTVFNSKKLPSNSSLYQIKNNEILINEPGNYELTLCGKINGKTTINIQTINTQSTLTNIASISSKINSLLFSKTLILEIDAKQRIRILFLQDDINANVDPLKLLIKRLPV